MIGFVVMDDYPFEGLQKLGLLQLFDIAIRNSFHFLFVPKQSWIF